jgi:hypothetical protein
MLMLWRGEKSAQARVPALLGLWGTYIYVISFAAVRPQVDCGLMLKLWRGEKSAQARVPALLGRWGTLLYVVGFAAV